MEYFEFNEIIQTHTNSIGQGADNSEFLSFLEQQWPLNPERQESLLIVLAEHLVPGRNVYIENFVSQVLHLGVVPSGANISFCVLSGLEQLTTSLAEAYFQKNPDSDAQKQMNLDVMAAQCARFSNPKNLEDVLDVGQRYGYVLDVDKVNHCTFILVENDLDDEQDQNTACLGILAKYPDFNVNTRNLVGKTPLMVAKLPRVASWLLDQGADPMAKTQDGIYVLEEAWVNDAHAATIALLLDRGATLESGPAYQDVENYYLSPQRTPGDDALLSAWRRKLLTEAVILPTQKKNTPKL